MTEGEPKFSRRVSRREFNQVALATLGLALLNACGGIETPAKVKKVPTKESLVFSGNRDETKMLLNQWARETSNRPDKVGEYLPNTAKLAIAYFSSEMSSILPNRKQQYDEFKNRAKVELLDEESFFSKLSQCNASVDRTGLTAVDIHDEKTIILNREPPLQARRIDSYFIVILYSSFLLSPPRKEYPNGKHIKDIPEPVRYERGLVAFSEQPKSNCGNLYRLQIEGAVAIHSTRELLRRIGLNLIPGSIYNEIAEKYQNQIIIPLYGGNFAELLEYQQETNSDEFFRSIGKKLNGNSLSSQEQLDLGDKAVRDIFLNTRPKFPTN